MSSIISNTNSNTIMQFTNIICRLIYSNAWNHISYFSSQITIGLIAYHRWSRGHKARGQGQGHKKILRPRPRTDPLEAKDQGHRRKCSPKKKGLQNFFQAISKKKVFKNFFQAKKVLKKFFSGDLYLKKPNKKSLQIFLKVSGVFQRNFNGSKIVLSSSRGQGNFRGLEASRPRPRTSKCVFEDVIEDYTSVAYTIVFTCPHKKSNGVKSGERGGQ